MLRAVGLRVGCWCWSWSWSWDGDVWERPKGKDGRRLSKGSERWKRIDLGWGSLLHVVEMELESWRCFAIEWCCLGYVEYGVEHTTGDSARAELGLL